VLCICRCFVAGYKVKGVSEAVEAEKSIKLSKLPQVGPAGSGRTASCCLWAI
jgi:hypothetical protein